MKKLIFSFSLIFFSSIFCKQYTVIIATGEYPPYSGKNLINYGLAVEITSEAFKAVNIPFKYDFLPWKRCEMHINSDKADAALPYRMTNDRKTLYYYSDLYIPGGSSFFYYKNSPIKGSLSNPIQLQELYLGANPGYWYLPKFEGNHLKLNFAPNEELLFRMLKAGRIDLVPANTLVGIYTIRKLFPNETDNFKILTDKTNLLNDPQTNSSMGIIISKNYPEKKWIINKLNTGLKIIKSNGKYNSIIKKYKGNSKDQYF